MIPFDIFIARSTEPKKIDHKKVDHAKKKASGNQPVAKRYFDFHCFFPQFCGRQIGSSVNYAGTVLKMFSCPFIG